MKREIINSKNRKYFILERLIDKEHLSYQQLSEEYFVSRSSIANDISFIKKLLVKEDITLQFDNSGTFFEASEVQIQKLLKRIILSNYSDNRVLDIFLNKALFDEVSTAFYKIVSEKKIEIAESYAQNILISIILMIQRSESGHKIHFESNRQLGNLFFEYNKYPLVYDILQAIENKKVYCFSETETQYLAYLIVGSGLSFFMKRENIPEAFRKNIRLLIQKISEGLQIDLTQDSQLEENLLVHVFQLFLRIEAHTMIINPLIEDIKERYPSLFGIVWLNFSDFCKGYQINLSDDEVGFITIHFQAAVERLKKMNKILFVCPNGMGTSSFISAKIRRILPNIDSIETTSISHLRVMDLSDVDFIISTIDIQNIEKPVVQISPMVNAEDMKKIMNRYIDLVIEREALDNELKEISADEKKIINQQILFTNFLNKEDAINQLINRQKFAFEVQKEKFTQSVFEREEVQSTYLGNGFAIPHGNPEFVEKTSVSIAILDTPILWGKQMVDVIVLLMVKNEDRKEMESIMNLVINGINDKNWFISKMMEVGE